MDSCVCFAWRIPICSHSHRSNYGRRPRGCIRLRRRLWPSSCSMDCNCRTRGMLGRPPGRTTRMCVGLRSGCRRISGRREWGCCPCPTTPLPLDGLKTKAIRRMCETSAPRSSRVCSPCIVPSPSSPQLQTSHYKLSWPFFKSMTGSEEDRVRVRVRVSSSSMWSEYIENSREGLHLLFHTMQR